MDENGENPAPAQGRRTGPDHVRACPICGKARVAAYRPFCSRRCADVDLGRWLGEVYAVPAEEPAAAPRGLGDAGEVDAEGD